MNAKLAPAKSVTFTSEAADRKWLRTHKWRRLGKTIPVILHARDLGAHLNTSVGKQVGTTLTARIRGTTKSVIRIGKMKAPYSRKTAVIRTKMLPKALYGCETAPINEAAMRTFRSEVADAAAYTTKRRSLDLTFTTSSHGTDIDPEIEVYVRRVTSFKRAIVISDFNGKMIDTILGIYREKHEPGTMTDPSSNLEALAQKHFAEEPGSSQRGKMRKQCNPKGPVGYLLETLHLNASVLDEEQTFPSTTSRL